MEKKFSFSGTFFKGCYILEFFLHNRQYLRLRSRCYHLQQGYYYYSGSAFGPGGLKARIGRHIRSDKLLHWDVDFLRAITKITAVYISAGNRNNEHVAANVFLQKPEEFIPVNHFGASDCSCFTHLFYTQQRKHIAKLFQNPETRYRRISLKSFELKV